MALVEFIALILASTTAPNEHGSKSKRDVIIISNVCIDIRHGYEYSVASNIDYFRINVSYNGTKGNIYVGHNPEILDTNRKWQSRVFRSKMKSSKVVVLEGEQAGQILGVPLNENDQYFHLWFKDATEESIETIKDIVGFCK